MHPTLADILLCLIPDDFAHQVENYAGAHGVNSHTDSC